MRYSNVLERVARALDDGTISERDLERLLDRRRQRRDVTRPDVSSVLAACGVLAAYAGFALLLALRWSHLHGTERTLTPFLFPAGALAAAVGLHRAGRPSWESELAGLVGYASLIAAFIAAADAFQPHDLAAFGMVAGAVGTAVVVSMHLALRNTRLTGWGLSIALVTLTGSAAAAAGVHHSHAGWVLLGQAVVAGAAGWLLLARGSSEAGAAAIRSGLLLAYAAALAGQPEDGFPHLSVWHAVISLAVIASFVLSAALELDGLVWIGVVGAVVWIGMAAALVGSSAGWAMALVLAGAALVGLSLLVAALRRRHAAIR
jgi:hypothetical protein